MRDVAAATVWTFPLGGPKTISPPSGLPAVIVLYELIAPATTTGSPPEKFAAAVRAKPVVCWQLSVSRSALTNGAAVAGWAGLARQSISRLRFHKKKRSGLVARDDGRLSQQCRRSTN